VTLHPFFRPLHHGTLFSHALSPQNSCVIIVIFVIPVITVLIQSPAAEIFFIP